MKKDFSRELQFARKKVRDAQEALTQQREANAVILNGPEGKPEEARGLTPEEIEKTNSLKKALEDAENNVRFLETEQAEYLGNQRGQQIGGGYMPDNGSSRNPEGLSDKDIADLKRFSWAKIVKNAANERAGSGLDGIEAEMHQEAQKEARQYGTSISGTGVPQKFLRVYGPNSTDGDFKRDLTATGQTSNPGDQGGLAIQTDIGQMIPALRPRVKIAGLGATVYNGLQGNVKFPRVSSEPDPTNLAENATSSEGNILYDSIDLSPNRIGIHIEVSDQLLKQQRQISEAYVIQTINARTNIRFDTLCISGTGSGNQPTGLLNYTGVGSVAGGTDGGAPTWDNMVELEGAVADDNADVFNMAYLTNSKVRTKLKKTRKDAGSGIMVWEQDAIDPAMINGYLAEVSNIVPNNLTKGSGTNLSAIIFGNWSELIMAFWGGMDFIVDPYTKSADGLVRIVMNTYFDMDLKHPESFAIMADAITT